ncbi:hypothetical protein [Shewanella sedimentimangrovi]|uniref:Uncharacterized protein n=1 Tax=Shewanella sedimentimangrovi TaxID=2814293 RepID=A0ABX7R4Q9_9GAMM|nr:hypothetical protein [Shewanella sedimentimangrovi]QSX38822.1 hypothetical protein JYB85_08480 [Shewanella sedimentimangrovi]
MRTSVFGLIKDDIEAEIEADTVLLPEHLPADRLSPGSNRHIAFASEPEPVNGQILNPAGVNVTLLPMAIGGDEPEPLHPVPLHPVPLHPEHALPDLPHEAKAQGPGETKPAVKIFGKGQLLAFAVLALLLHLGIVALLSTFNWQIPQSLSKQQPKPAALKSYLYVAPPAPVIAELPPEPSAPLPNEAQVEPIQAEAKPEVETEPKPDPKPTLETKKAAQIVAEVEEQVQEPLPEVEQEKQAGQAAAQNQFARTPVDAQPKLDFSTSASRFIADKNAQALETLGQEYADRKTIPGGMSEMLPDMEVLEVPNADDIYKPSTLDHRLDPNRIIKKGDTCYRIVKVPTPLNPHAENPGFPFNCGGDKVKQAIKEGINRHLERMGRKINR